MYGPSLPQGAPLSATQVILQHKLFCIWILLLHLPVCCNLSIWLLQQQRGLQYLLKAGQALACAPTAQTNVSASWPRWSHPSLSLDEVLGLMSMSSSNQLFARRDWQTAAASVLEDRTHGRQWLEASVG